MDSRHSARPQRFDVPDAVSGAVVRAGSQGRLSDSSLLGIGVVDLAGRTTSTNETLRLALGFSQEEFAARQFTSYVHPEDVTVQADRLAQLVCGEIDRFSMDLRFIRRDGGILWVALTGSLVRDAHGNPDHVINVTQDVSERKLFERDPRAVEQRSQLQVERVPAIVYVAEPGPYGRWLYVSPQIETILGFSAQEWMADPGLWQQRLETDDRAGVQAEEERVLIENGSSNGVASSTYRLHHRNGATVWVRDDAIMIWDEEHRATWHGVLVDVTAEKLLEERLEHQAFHDPLTGLPNRELFYDRVSHALKKRQPGQIAVLFIDLDNFKSINDGFGHACGDEVIAAAALRLQSCARAGDTAARVGGDEFALLVEDLTAEQVTALADRVLDALSRTPVEFSGSALNMGASIGIAVAGPGETTETLLRNADLAMYEAKQQGRCRHVLYEPIMHATVIKRIRLKAAMQTALADSAVALAYQPIVDLITGVVVGFEALARWTDPQIGEVSPGDFIPAAEESGLIHELGHWVINKACRDLTLWRSVRSAEAYVSVNVSPLQLDNDQFASQVMAILVEHHLEPSALVLEVTEGVLLVERSRQSLRELRSHGVRVAIDNFGTGYSSLSYLRQLPVDMVKIDHTFLCHLDDGSAELGFLRAIIRLAETLHLATICEGIETAGQLSDLQAVGCGYGQGNFLAISGPIEDVPRTIEEDTSFARPLTDLSRARDGGAGIRTRDAGESPGVVQTGQS